MNMNKCRLGSSMLRCLVTSVFLALLAPLALAQTAIEAVTGSMQGGGEFVRIDFSNAFIVSSVEDGKYINALLSRSSVGLSPLSAAASLIVCILREIDCGVIPRMRATLF